MSMHSFRPAIVLVKRVIEQDTWWEDCFYRKLRVRDLKKYEPITKYIPEEYRDHGVNGEPWHIGRVHHFYNMFKEGRRVTRAKISGFNIHNGCHRVAAAYFARVKELPVLYRGAKSLLRYLTGEDKKLTIGEFG